MSDFEFEFQMALMNRRLSPSLEVAFLMPSQQYTYLNSTLVKEVVRLGGAVRGLVPRGVEEYLRARYPASGRKKPVPRAHRRRRRREHGAVPDPVAARRHGSRLRARARCPAGARPQQRSGALAQAAMSAILESIRRARARARSA